MRRGRNVGTLDTVVYRGPDDCCEIEVHVTGHVVPYVAPSFHEPGEGGYVEDLRATFMDGKEEREIPLTDAEASTFEEQILEQEPDYDG
jgi:hypothetical protein